MSGERGCAVYADHSVFHECAHCWWTSGDDQQTTDLHYPSIQVILPDSLRGRAEHTTSIVHTDPTHKQLVTHGGYHEWPKDNKLNSVVPVTATTIVELGEFM